MTKDNTDICEIYIIGNIINDKFYVGQSWRGTQQRFNHHKNNKTGDCPKLFNAMNCHGRENFYVMHVASIKTDNQKEVDDLEDSVILQYNCIDNGYNIRRGGSTGKLTEEDKLKKSIAANERWKKIKEECGEFGVKHYMQGENNPMFGKTHAEDALIKMSEAAIGRIVNEATREKLSFANSGENNGFYGKQHSEETKQKLSELLTGRIISEEKKRKMSESKKGMLISDGTKLILSGCNSGENNPMFGKTHTDEAKAKMSNTHKEIGTKPPSFAGKEHTEETKSKMSVAHTGRIFSEEHRKNMSISKIGIGKGVPKSEESKRKNALAHLGPLSPETLAKCRETRAKNKLIKEQKQQLGTQMQHFYASTIYANLNLTESQIENLEIKQFNYNLSNNKEVK